MIEALPHAHGAARSTGPRRPDQAQVEAPMYRYDAIDKDMLADRAAEFRGQVARRLAGEITEDQFKPLRLMNGLYLQLHAYMLRIAIPYGTLNSAPAAQAGLTSPRTYDKGYGHFTTRTNLQFHWIKLKDAPDILDAPGRGRACTPSRPRGNCIRNVTADPYAGATAEEVDDPRVWAEAIRQWSTLHPEFCYLPRKFKIAVTAAPKDRTAAQRPRHRPAACSAPATARWASR